MYDDEDEGSEELQKKPNYNKFFGMSTATNPREMFNQIILDYAAKDPNLEEKLSKIAPERGNIYSIGIGVLKNPATNGIAVSTNLIAQVLLLSALKMGWKDMIQKMIVDGYDKRRGFPLSLIFAFIFALEKGLCAQVREALNANLENEKKEEVCALLSSIGDKKLVSSFKNELVEIVEEEDDAKIAALGALSLIVDEDVQVREVFSELLDDWQDEARFLCASVLVNVKDEKVALRALDILPEETNAETKFHLYGIIENNLKFILPVLKKRLFECESKEGAKKIIEILIKIDKGEKVREIATEAVEKTNGEVKELLETFLKG